MWFILGFKQGEGPLRRAKVALQRATGRQDQRLARAPAKEGRRPPSPKQVRARALPQPEAGARPRVSSAKEGRAFPSQNGFKNLIFPSQKALKASFSLVLHQHFISPNLKIQPPLHQYFQILHTFHTPKISNFTIYTFIKDLSIS